jgi:hypothetical protein
MKNDLGVSFLGLTRTRSGEELEIDKDQFLSGLFYRLGLR